jgi:hypothetical protein
MAVLEANLPIIDSQSSNITIKFPLPKIKIIMSQCAICKFCCSWCQYITNKGCTSPTNDPLLEVCQAFPILIGNSESRWPSFGIESQGDVYPPEFGAFAVYGRSCQSTQDERQRLIYQFAAQLINGGKRSFSIFEECPDYTVYIQVLDPLLSKNKEKLL